MRFNQSEIVEDILQHLRQRGGENSEWCVGTARDPHQRFSQQHAAADAGDGLIEPNLPIWLIWREAYTTFAAAEVMDRLKDCGLRPDRDSIPGDIVFAYHPATQGKRCLTPFPLTPFPPDTFSSLQGYLYDANLDQTFDLGRIAKPPPYRYASLTLRRFGGIKGLAIFFVDPDSGGHSGEIRLYLPGSGAIRKLPHPLDAGSWDVVHMDDEGDVIYAGGMVPAVNYLGADGTERRLWPARP